MNALADAARRMERVADGFADPSVLHAAGGAAKRVAVDLSSSVTGGDRRLSGWGRRGIRLGVGYEPAGPTAVEVSFRPYGVWKVMFTGRKASKTIRPRSAQRRRRRSAAGPRALATPFGPRASVRSGRTRPKASFPAVTRDAADAAGKAAARQVTVNLRKAF